MRTGGGGYVLPFISLGLFSLFEEKDWHFINGNILSFEYIVAM